MEGYQYSQKNLLSEDVIEKVKHMYKHMVANRNKHKDAESLMLVVSVQLSPVSSSVGGPLSPCRPLREHAFEVSLFYKAGGHSSGKTFNTAKYGPL